MSDIYQPPLLFGKYENRFNALTALGVPTGHDELAVEAKTYPHIAIDGDVIWIWSVADQIWKQYNPGEGLQFKTKAEIDVIVAAEGLVSGTQYMITDRGDNGLLLRAASATQFQPEAIRFMFCPAEYRFDQTDGSANHWMGIWHLSKSFSVDDLAIWGGKVWRNTSGATGTADDNITLSAADWDLVAKDTFANDEYVQLIFGCMYDYENDWIAKQWDFYGNVFGVGKVTEDTIVAFGFNLCDVSDWNSNTQSKSFFGNKCYGVYNNYTGVGSGFGFGVSNNVMPGAIFNNKVTFSIDNNKLISGNINSNDAAWVLSNTCVAGISDNTSAAGIYANGEKVAGILNNFSNNIDYNNCEGSIYNNTVASQITHNANNGGINDNSCFSITYNTNKGDINDNSNGGNISYNTCGGPIHHNSNSGEINYNSNSFGIYSNENGGNIDNNMNHGTIDSNGVNCQSIVSNSNSGSISGNNNLGDISGNSNRGTISNNIDSGATFGIVNNNNLGEINSNQLSGFIARNSNNDKISANILLNGNVLNNKNAGNIYQNTVTGSITFNSCNGDIQNNNDGNIFNIINNRNNGAVDTNTSSGPTINISFNENNGIISGVWGADVNDPVVDKV